MKLLDYIIVASLVGCMFIGYFGHRFVALLLLLLVVTVASWRYWDKRRESEMLRTRHGSGELNPELDHWADVRTQDDAAGSSADGGD
jgi:hypothetical protein